ncbi:hypothetical protein MHPYR_230069 [uncultured Mycobacterium sp.]|uniref:Uncharacterized protein n=1 Tax=uncultured Mycobacterium sp. TaxID=171292 RepID=A0A1Y5PDU4_9MYCO|nr:hypothetical protein MHPYR_230069 [uncultured Mycobacterium sp.]
MPTSIRLGPYVRGRKNLAGAAAVVVDRCWSSLTALEDLTHGPDAKRRVQARGIVRSVDAGQRIWAQQRMAHTRRIFGPS